MKRLKPLLITILLGSDAAFAGEVGVWGRAMQFSKNERWANCGVIFNDRYTLGITGTEDGSAVEFGLAYPFNRLGMIASMAHLSAGHIAQSVYVKDASYQDFHGYYSMLTLNYTLLFVGARAVERDIDHDLIQRRGRIVRKSTRDFFIGAGLVISPP